jgi:hypothetical protein
MAMGREHLGAEAINGAELNSPPTRRVLTGPEARVGGVRGAWLRA